MLTASAVGRILSEMEQVFQDCPKDLKHEYERAHCALATIRTYLKLHALMEEKTAAHCEKPKAR